ncbi:MAG TPA: single-stranded-DNA-specific exonuclease RecJ, partial [Candidatus Limnocylindrales bacterium]|nr:single-stranded-DNA-specific exonuclease RecJ [Candidatus Limnocylindrales bacterium]
VAARGIDTPDALRAFLADPLDGLHDPALLPDAALLVERIRLARERDEVVLVFGDFDADGLTGLAILARALRALRLRAEPYVPSRLDEGHGLSLEAVRTAERLGARLIVTVDTGSSSGREIGAAAERGIDVIVTDHHRVPPVAPPALALVNAHRPDASYPDARLSGAGVAFKVAQLLVRELAATGPGGLEPFEPLDLADLAAIGTVADLAPVLGENRAIARLGLARLRTNAHAGLAALLARAGVVPARADLETIAFAIAPRLNAAGRVGDPMDAARLLLTDDPSEADALAERLEAANGERRELTRAAIADARGLVASGDGPILIRGAWPVGIVGLVASRLVDDTGRAAVVATDTGGVLRASCRSDGIVDLGAALEGCADLLERHGGHPGAAGFELLADRWDVFCERFRLVVEALAPAATAPDTGEEPDARRPLRVELALEPGAVDYGLLRDLARLEPTGPGHPEVLVAISGLIVVRVRAASGGHTQVTLRRERDVLDAIAFGRDDLPALLAEGDRVDVVARLASRTFGGFESLQLDVRDVAGHGAETALVAALAEAAIGRDSRAPSVVGATS